jgi:hypothetical protein
LATTPDLLADLRRLEEYAIAGSASDRWLGEAISRLTLLCLGVPIARVDGFLRAQQLIEHGLAVTTACSRAGLSRSAFYRLCQRVGHELCEPRARFTASR